MLLNEKVIRDHLETLEFQSSLGINIFPTIDSTNRYLKDMIWTHCLELCCAEQQTNGRGRSQKTWFSPNKGNLYCSVGVSLPSSLPNLSALSLVIGIAIRQTIAKMGISADIRLKWPNDLLWEGKKLCGVLLEAIPNKQHIRVIIGIGLNVNIDPRDETWLHAQNKPWCSLLEITGKTIDRNRLLAILISQTEQIITQFTLSGLHPFLETWQKCDALLSKKITISYPNKSILGVAQGINTQGELILIDDKQQVHYIASGEASIVIP